jgi:uncharacterized membrane protein YeaQ/YmgE (transglycosylase-associated protein family)
MGIIAWILLGLASGLLARRLLPGGSAQELSLTCAAGVCGALFGGWAAVGLFRSQALDVFFSIPAWLAALFGAAAFLLAAGALTGGPIEPRQKGKGVPVAVPVRRRDTSR